MSWSFLHIVRNILPSKMALRLPFYIYPCEETLSLNYTIITKCMIMLRISGFVCVAFQLILIQFLKHLMEHFSLIALQASNSLETFSSRVKPVSDSRG